MRIFQSEDDHNQGICIKQALTAEAYAVDGASSLTPWRRIWTIREKRRWPKGVAMKWNKLAGIIFLVGCAGLTDLHAETTNHPSEDSAKSDTTNQTRPNVEGAGNRIEKISLEQAVEEGLRANLDLMVARYNISLAEADALTAGLWSNPTLQLDTVFQPFGGNWDQTSSGGPTQYDLLVTYPLDLSSKRSAAKRSALEATKVTEAAFQDAVRQKVLQIRLAYIDVMTLQSQLSLSREREASLRSLVQMIENKIGKKTLLPLLQRRAQLALDQAALDTKSRENAVRTAKTALAILLGRQPVESGIDTSTKLRDFNLSEPPSEDSFIQQAIEQRPDLRALRLTQSKADLDYGLAKAQVWDNFNLQAGVSHQGPNAPNPNDPASAGQSGAYSWSMAIQIPLPLFNRNQGNIRKAVVTRGQTEKQTAALILSIQQEIDSDLRQLNLNREFIEEYEEGQLESARKVRDSQQTLFGTGGSAILDYFDAINAYQGTLSSYYDGIGEYRRSVARLNAAVGKDVLQ